MAVRSMRAEAASVESFGVTLPVTIEEMYVCIQCFPQRFRCSLIP
jgi:hypothetical protein